MKKALSIVLLMTLILSLTSCHRLISTVRFVIDGEVVETYRGSSKSIKFPTPKEKEGMEFYGWLTEEYLDDNLVTEENIGKYFGFWPSLTLYAHYVVAEPDNKTPTEPENQDKQEENKTPNSDSNMDVGGWT